MTSGFPEELLLRRKWTFRAHDRQIVLEKKSLEKPEHVLMKAFLWALYLPAYPDLGVEISIGDRYKPDLIALCDEGRPVFWGECGQIKTSKIRSILKRFSGIHLAIARWNTGLSHFQRNLERVLDDLNGDFKIELLNFPGDSPRKFILENMSLKIRREDIEIITYGD